MRGRVEFQSEGKTFALRYTINRLCYLEELSGISVLEFAAKLDNPKDVKISEIRLLMKVGLEGEFTEDEAGEIIQDITLPVAVALISQSFAGTFSAEKSKPGPKARARAA